jgi:hypothetical protein
MIRFHLTYCANIHIYFRISHTDCLIIFRYDLSQILLPGSKKEINCKVVASFFSVVIFYMQFITNVEIIVETVIIYVYDFQTVI